jgi:hydrogenase/urease accessory protein HupE
MDRRKIENITASLAVLLLFCMTFVGILLMGDLFFNWDIFSPEVEKLIAFSMASCSVIIFSSVLVNVMLNLSIIAINSDEFLETYERSQRKK